LQFAELGIMMQALVQQLLQFSLHSYKGVRDTAVLALESCTKQYPAYIMQLLPVPLAALAKLPIPQADLTNQVHDLAPEVLDSLRGAMRQAASSSTVTTSAKADDASAAGEYWHSVDTETL
jgi:chemotaxis response regulator CheB